MNDYEKFQGFKQKQIEENEAKYGREVRETYGDQVVNASNAKVKGMTEAQWQRAQELSEEINRLLAEAVRQGDPAGDIAKTLCQYHKEWLCLYWPEGLYSKEAHKSLADGYVTDPRFAAYYEKAASGGAQFLRDAIHLWCDET